MINLVPQCVKCGSPVSDLVEPEIQQQGEVKPVGKPLLIFGTSAGNTIATSINCKVSVSLNGIKPYQRVIATGPSGSGDYSKWNFTLSPKYASIKQGHCQIFMC